MLYYIRELWELAKQDKHAFWGALLGKQIMQKIIAVQATQLGKNMNVRKSSMIKYQLVYSKLNSAKEISISTVPVPDYCRTKFVF